jgi:ankyrin repeat protein
MGLRAIRNIGRHLLFRERFSVSRQHRVGLIASVFVLWAPYWAYSSEGSGNQGLASAALPGTNSISNVSVKPAEEGRWLVDFDYFFTGEPSDAMFHIDLTLQTRADAVTPLIYHGPPVKRPQSGAHHFATSFDYSSAGTSTQFIVSMTNGGFGVTTASADVRVLATQRIDQVVTWPSAQERQFYLARDMISNGRDDDIHRARPLLEQLIAKNPKFDPAFVELARIAMKTNWGPEGLHQAEALLDSALEIRPDSVDAKILLGYVYTHQNRLGEAEALFVDAAKSDPPNVWLWTNWGDLLAMQSHTDQAIGKYREAVKRPPNLASGEARMQAYRRLLELLKARMDFDGMEAIYKQRIGEYSPGSCFSADYARFELNVRKNPQAAIDLAHAALNLDCEDTPSREVLGLASYVLWAQRSGSESTEALNQARIYVPPGPMALYLLANNDNTMAAARKLLKTGDSIDGKDNEQMTALGYALEKGDVETVERLLRLGARSDVPVGTDAMPAALLPVLEGNVKEIRVLKRAGVNYSKLRYRGATALDFAKQTGNDALLQELADNESAL